MSIFLGRTITGVRTSLLASTIGTWDSTCH